MLVYSYNNERVHLSRLCKHSVVNGFINKRGLELKYLRCRHQQIWHIGACCLVLLSVSLEERWDPLLESLKGTNPTPEGSFCMTQSPSNVPASNTVALGIRVST